MAGVYISWPFCAQKCTYCNFASGVAKPDTQSRYLDALCLHLSRQIWPFVPETIYFGGGTPSLLTAEAIGRILEQIPGRPWREVTIEAAPGSLQPESVSKWADLGINRVSLGVQSFVEKELRQTGRRHTAQIVENDCRLLRSAGIQNFNVDLIAGLPHQNASSWEESLRWIEHLDPPHVSVYMLEVDSDSRLGLEILQGGSRYGASNVAGDDEITANYERAVAFLDSLGIERYEISNFARPGLESSHNLKYWRMEPYLGFGVDAHSFDGALRWACPAGAQEYVNYVARGAPHELDAEPVRPDEERFLTGLRLAEGLRVNMETLPARLQNELEELIARGILAWNRSNLRFTPRGILVSNEVFEKFLGLDSVNS
ncbi:MAG: radical SAM family heme chaperone HemW [Bryobacterales bacterium]|nr:radical SAM family heme chaperone HemW [Bryobacterales bacterium]